MNPDRQIAEAATKQWTPGTFAGAWTDARIDFEQHFTPAKVLQLLDENDALRARLAKHEPSRFQVDLIVTPAANLLLCSCGWRHKISRTADESRDGDRVHEAQVRHAKSHEVVALSSKGIAS